MQELPKAMESSLCPWLHRARIPNSLYNLLSHDFTVTETLFIGTMSLLPSPNYL